MGYSVASIDIPTKNFIFYLVSILSGFQFCHSHFRTMLLFGLPCCLWILFIQAYYETLYTELEELEAVSSVQDLLAFITTTGKAKLSTNKVVSNLCKVTLRYIKFFYVFSFLINKQWLVLIFRGEASRGILHLIKHTLPVYWMASKTFLEKLVPIQSCYITITTSKGEFYHTCCMLYM